MSTMTEARKAMLATRQRFTPERGKTYTNEGDGGSYYCINGSDQDALLRNIKSGWTFLAHGVGRYADGSIDWDYSTGGRFT